MASLRESAPSGDKPRPITHEQRLRRGIHQSGLPDGEVRLFMILLDKAEFGSAIMRAQFAPTASELVRLCRKSRATVFRRLAHLERHRWAVLPRDAKHGPSSKIVRVLQVGDPCECRPHGGNRRKRAGDEPTPTPTPTPTPETVSSWRPSESHLGAEKSLILKAVSAGQPVNRDYGATMGKDLWEVAGRNPSLDRSLESWRSWSAGTIGYEANQGSERRPRTDTP
jgi:hypothetical protein